MEESLLHLLDGTRGHDLHAGRPRRVMENHDGRWFIPEGEAEQASGLCRSLAGDRNVSLSLAFTLDVGRVEGRAHSGGERRLEFGLTGGAVDVPPLMH